MEKDMTFKEDQVIQERFQILQVLGRGSQAIVYKAYDLKQRRLVAIKQYQHTDYYQRQDINQILEESKLLQRIKHRNVCQCYQTIQLECQIIQILEHIEGSTLKEFIARQFPGLIDLDTVVNLPELMEKMRPLDSPDLLSKYQSYIRNTLKHLIQQRDISTMDVQSGYKQQQAAEQSEAEYQQLVIDSQENLNISSPHHTIKRIVS